MAFYDGNGKKINLDETMKVNVYGLPTVYVTCPDAGENMDVLSDGEKHDITIKYVDGEKKFELYGSCKKQGNFTSAGTKKNINVTLYNDKARTQKQKIAFNGWYPHSKFHIKGNRSDYSMVRNSVITRIAREFCGGLALPEGAMGYIDSFPIILYWNDVWYGCYTWNLSQDEKTFNFDDDNGNHMAFRYESDWKTVDGWEFRGDEDCYTDAMRTTFAALIAKMVNADSLTREIVEANFDVNSLLAYIAFLQIGHMNDSTANNWTLATWDGVKWHHIFYDCDIGFGFFNGGSFPTSGKLAMNTFHEKVATLFPDELKAVYSEMRSAGLTAERIADDLFAYQRKWGWQNLQKECAKWESDKPFKVGLDNVRADMTARIAWADEYFGYTAT